MVTPGPILVDGEFSATSVSGGRVIAFREMLHHVAIIQRREVRLLILGMGNVRRILIVEGSRPELHVHDCGHGRIALQRLQGCRVSIAARWQIGRHLKALEGDRQCLAKLSINDSRRKAETIEHHLHLHDVDVRLGLRRFRCDRRGLSRGQGGQACNH